MLPTAPRTLSGGTPVSLLIVWVLRLTSRSQQGPADGLVRIGAFFLPMNRSLFKQVFENLFIIEIQARCLSLELNATLVKKLRLFVELLYSFPSGTGRGRLYGGGRQLPL